jgi:hypothetical protein
MAFNPKDSNYKKVKFILNSCINSKKSAPEICKELGFSKTYLKNLRASLQDQFDGKKLSKKEYEECQDLYSKYEKQLKPVPKPEVEKIVKSTEVIVDEDRQIRKLREDVKIYKNKYEHVHKELEIAEKRCEIVDSLYNSEAQIYHIDPDKNFSKEKGEAAAIVQLSDWHVEERVDKKTVNGLNEYNPDIAKFRAENCFRNILKLVKKERNDIKIDKLVLYLGGDFINNFLRMEMVEDNYMNPIEATLFAKDLLFNGIKFLADNGNFKEIVIPTSVGNHGRTTEKLHISTSYKNSYEWLLYKYLADAFKEYKNINFIISESEFNYIKVYDKTLRFFHGQNIKFGGGIGGLSVPLIKVIHRLNTQIHADYNYVCHWHQYIHPTKDCTVNGSLIGFSPYSQYIGAAPEPPVQGFRLLDSKRGFTVTTPIICWE